MTIRAIHEQGCLCTSCLTGTAIGVDNASPSMIADLLAGRIENWSGLEPEVNVTVRLGGHTFEHVPLRDYPPVSTGGDDA